jgi:RNA ligase (TIGR02306 family)
MSTFSCPLVRVSEVIDHPNADRLSIVKLEGLGYTCISGKLEDGSPRYKAGDWVVYIPSAAILPEYLLKEMDFWNAETRKGMLAGSNGDRVKPLRLRGIFSEGVLYPASVTVNDNTEMMPEGYLRRYWQVALGESDGELLMRIVRLMPVNKLEAVESIAGRDMSERLGITKYEPPIPVHMAGEVANLFDHTVRYDFERLESVPDMFASDMTVTATEKLHGTFCAIVYEPGLNHAEMFGTNGDIIVHSKGLGGQGLAFKNNAANDGNLYVKTLRKLLGDGLEDRFRTLATSYAGKRYAILGEIYGKGVQDLAYGTKEPEFRMFDVMVDDIFLPQDELGFDHSLHGIPFAPVLYNGPFNIEALTAVRDGKTTVGGDNIREGIVVRAGWWQRHPIHGRRIAKMISPDYLLRKVKGGEATEYT